MGHGEVADLSAPASPSTTADAYRKIFTFREGLMEEMEGYTEEEFEAILKVINMEGVYNLAIANGRRKPVATPRERLELINRYVLTRKKHGKE
jgi:hypothetical protein